MSQILHITNGDGAANLLKASTRILGDVLPWRDPMHHGPFEYGLSLPELSNIRARYLSGPGLSFEETKRGFTLRDRHLMASEKYEKIILWFEHDLLDQLQILQLLDWFSQQANMGNRLFLICIDDFPNFENFRGLGQLDIEQLETLIGKEQSVTNKQFGLAKKAWEAFCSNNPNAILKLLNSDCTHLPYLAPCLLRLLEEYPWLEDGLSRSERQILQIINSGETRPGRIFHETMVMEKYLYAGDWRIFSHISDLNIWGLIECKSGEQFKSPPHMAIAIDDFKKQELVMTNIGQQVLAKQTTGFEIIDRDEWLGGVHLKAHKEMWVWDNQNQKFILYNDNE